MLPINCIRQLVNGTCISVRFGVQRQFSQKPKTGIVLINMGGPEKSEQVQNYLEQIMTDKDMIQLPFAQNYMGRWIAKRRTADVQKKYNEIGGGSPILKWTNKQGKLMCERLDRISPGSAPHKHYVAFRYVPPYTSDAFAEIERDSVERVVLFSQYPQYSCATSGSSFNAVYSHLKKKLLSKNFRMSIIDRWATNPLLVKCFAEMIKEKLKNLPESKRNNYIILFSAHSLPLKTVNRGDSYPAEVGATVQLVMEELKFCNPYQLVWQSKVGPLPWLGPFTDQAIKCYVKQGRKNFIIVPIAFVNEHIETLHELDIEYCHELAQEVGVEDIIRVPAPNDHPIFIDALSNIVQHHLQSNVAVIPKFLNRCPHCINANCYNSKKWFLHTCKV